jgi:pilus assembly protein CpaF
MSAKEPSDCLTALEPWLEDPQVTGIMVNGWEKCFLEHGRRLVSVPTPFRDDEHLMRVIQALLAPLGREIGPQCPVVEARLLDGSRVHAVIPPVAVIGPALTLRKLPAGGLTTQDLIRLGTWSEQIVTFVQACVLARLNILVAGGTGAGKTTILNRIVEMIPVDERIITIESSSELQLPPEFTRRVRLEGRSPDAEGKGGIALRELVLNALRMRPDRFVVGEVGGPEVFELLQAMNVGHNGTLCSVYATSVRDALSRLEMAAISASPALPLLNVRREVASAIDLILYQERLYDGSRKVLKVSELAGMRGDAIQVEDIYAYRRIKAGGEMAGVHVATGYVPTWLDRLQRAGRPLPADLFAPT